MNKKIIAMLLGLVLLLVACSPDPEPMVRMEDVNCAEMG